MIHIHRDKALELAIELAERSIENYKVELAEIRKNPIGSAYGYPVCRVEGAHEECRQRVEDSK